MSDTTLEEKNAVEELDRAEDASTYEMSGHHVLLAIFWVLMAILKELRGRR